MNTPPLDHGLTAVPGIVVGHCEVANGASGCSVVLARESAVAGVDVRGGAPGTREIALLDPVNTVQKIHAVALSGGSAFGLDTASGVMRYLADHRIGVEIVGDIIDPATGQVVAGVRHPKPNVLDGDTIFALATGESDAEVNLLTLGALAADVTADAIVRGVKHAWSWGNYPSVDDFRRLKE